MYCNLYHQELVFRYLSCSLLGLVSCQVLECQSVIIFAAISSEGSLIHSFEKRRNKRKVFVPLGT